jgi:hypothetical protein
VAVAVEVVVGAVGARAEAKAGVKVEAAAKVAVALCPPRAPVRMKSQRFEHYSNTVLTPISHHSNTILTPFAHRSDAILTPS